MIEVAVGEQGNGATFRLTPETRMMLEARFSGWSRGPKGVFLEAERLWDFSLMRDLMWAQVVMLLTGLTEQQIQELGGFTFVDPVDHEVFFESHAAA
ncbi:MAG TPA: hypothetical protein VGP73_20040 [Thermoanaerobaculia bacterium]